MTAITETPPTREKTFLEEVASRPGGEDINSCIQCGTCTASCPNAKIMDYTPREMIALTRAGERKKVLSSNSMWVCASCYMCTVRCPRDIKPTDLMHAFEALAIQHGMATRRVGTPIAYQAFVDSIKSNGRVHEFGMMFKYYLKTNPFAALKMSGLALKLLTHRRMSLTADKIKGVDQIKKIAEKAKTLE